MIRRRLSGPQPLDKEPDAQRPPDGSPAGSHPAAEPPQPYRNVPSTIKPKEADVSQRPESIQSVPRAGGDQTVTVIGNGARLEGNLTCRSLIVSQGAIFSGQSIMDGGARKPTGPTPVPSPSPGPSPSPSPSGPSAPGGPAPGSSK